MEDKNWANTRFAPTAKNKNIMERLLN